MRRPQDPVDKTFDFWRRLTPEQASAFDQRVRGYKIAMGLCDAPAPRKRKAKEPAAAKVSA